MHEHELSSLQHLKLRVALCFADGYPTVTLAHKGHARLPPPPPLKSIHSLLIRAPLHGPVFSPLRFTASDQSDQVSFSIVQFGTVRLS